VCALPSVPARVSRNFHAARIKHNLQTKVPSSAIYATTSTATEPCRLQLTTSKPFAAPQAFVSRRPINLHQGANICVTIRFWANVTHSSRNLHVIQLARSSACLCHL